MKIEGARLLLTEQVTVGSSHYDARLAKALKLDGVTPPPENPQPNGTGTGRGRGRGGRGRGQAWLSTQFPFKFFNGLILINEIILVDWLTCT